MSKLARKRNVASRGQSSSVSRPEDVQGWSRHEGRHALDGYLEDVMALHAQGVDPADDRSARLFVKDGRLMVISTKRETLEEIRRAMQSGCDVVGKLARRPDQDTLEDLLRDAPFSRVGLPPPTRAARALPAHEDVVDDDTDGDRVPPARGVPRRSTRNE